MSAYVQSSKVIEEAHEIRRALIWREGDARVIEECWDTIQATEGVLRKYPKRKVLLGFIKCKMKCFRRGDYDGSIR